MIACPGCNWARITEEGRKTALCPRCGRTIDLSKVRIVQKCTDRSEAGAVVGEANRKAQGGENDPAFEVDMGAELPPLSGKGSRRDDWRSAISEIGSKGPFTALELANNSALDPSEAEAVLARLMESGEIYSPEPGRYALIDL